jgi:quinol monooxygenase YgiN
MSYGYLGSIRTRPERRDSVIAILLRGADGLRAAGCQLYIVSASLTDPDMIWVTEVWTSKAHHDESLNQPDAKAAVAEAMPMLTGEFTSQELTVVGGLGV